MGDKMIIIPIAGLCNRLRVIFSYFYKARQEYKQLIVLWRDEIDCNGFFLDYFKEIPGITFYLEKEFPNNKIDYTGCHIHPDFEPEYSLLYLKPEVQEKVNECILKLEKKYISIHVRRMKEFNYNLRKNNIKPTPFWKYEKFIDKYWNLPLYISVDNLIDQKILYNRYKNRIPIIHFIQPSDNFRPTSLLQAIIDLYICISSTYFHGTKFSTFTTFIHEMRCTF